MTVTNKEGLKVYLPLDEIEELRKIASEQDRAVTYIVRQAITEFLSKRNGSSTSPATGKRGRAATQGG